MRANSHDWGLGRTRWFGESSLVARKGDWITSRSDDDFRRCPPVFGEFECPIGLTCKDNQCLGRDNVPSVQCGFETECSDETVCVEGKCYPLPTIKCNRHVLTADGQARSIVTDCGKKGKCLNGQCVADTFCLGHADCGPDMDCRTNRCRIRAPEPICSCQPHEICHHGQCYPNTPIGVDCHDDVCRGGTVCINSVCVIDPCPGRCPVDQSCRLGECRIMEGLPCVSECSGPFSCIDGRCRRNESCETGQCTRVAGRFCTWAPRDCGQAFTCKDNDLISTAPRLILVISTEKSRLMRYIG
ncbi:unnamed protein product [Nippostrongylus brasiliensis]|uniref:Tenascin n=1 Tax=Nippostrongylus brasiliensis TaxID=27835 RepID=A0A0N4YDP0_NIPBR|nr:unnamed protein product [Nippostrongylus brasiliensis]